MEKFEMYLVAGLGFTVFLLGVLLVWAGLNLPGTTGHPGTYPVTLMCVSGGVMGIGAGNLIINTAASGNVTWRTWLSALTVLISLMSLCYATYLRASELGVF